MDYVRINLSKNSPTLFYASRNHQEEVIVNALLSFYYYIVPTLVSLYAKKPISLPLPYYQILWYTLIIDYWVKNINFIFVKTGQPIPAIPIAAVTPWTDLLVKHLYGRVEWVQRLPLQQYLLDGALVLLVEHVVQLGLVVVVLVDLLQLGDHLLKVRDPADVSVHILLVPAHSYWWFNWLID